MRVRPRPPFADYVAAQRLTNTRHADGMLQKPAESYPVFLFVEALQDLEEPTPQSVLVIGCRLGYECEYLRRQWPHAEVVGLDIVPQFVEKTNQTGQAVLADMHDLPFSPSGFQWVFCSETLEHAYDAPLAAREILRVASRGIYVTAALEDCEMTNPSHWSFSQAPREWEHLFDEPSWRLLTSDTLEGSLHMLFLRDSA